MTRAVLLSALVLGFAPALMVEGAAAAQDFCTVDASDFEELDAAEGEGRVVCAEVAALDQMLVYNRFGSHNPFGMIFALTRDLVPADRPAAAPPGQLAEFCDEDPGIHPRPEGLVAGEVRLRDCKRPLTLRANVGDILHVRVRNLLRHGGSDGRPDYSGTFCRQGGEAGNGLRTAIRSAVSEGTRAEDGSEDLAFTDAGGADKLVAALCDGGSRDRPARLVNGPEAGDWPRTRGISFVIDGLRPLRDPATGVVDDVCLGLGQLAPGQDHVDCYWHAEREGPYFVNSVGAASGGEGDGGSLVHGLFGSLAVEPQAEEAPATRWYRSQTSRAALDAAWQPDNDTESPHDRRGALDYEATVPVGGEDMPVLNLLKRIGDGRYELVHNDLNAIIRPAEEPAFREFSVLFHDELKTFYTRNFEELGRFPQLAGVGDGFAINYGASGLGAMILANRKGIGPAADCMECLYEEFFLESWANGDPALLEGYPDDPSNVHHSYLNDPVVFRNHHAGPKETHVFHLHAHQWFAGNDGGRGAYLDSQTVAPRQGFTYRVYHGGLSHYTPDGKAPEGGGWWQSLGSGNRNRTVGDSIFHCHLYPHFAQGMWALWRVHDVLEDGSRRLPDGQELPGLSTELLERDAGGRLAPVAARSGSVGRDGAFIPDAPGTPIPAVIPLPDQAAPLLPTYASGDGDDAVPADEAVPGYPFFIAGRPGHRAPQPPLDMAAGTGPDNWLDGGLPRHVVTGGSRRELGVAADLGDLGIMPDSPEEDRRRVEDRLYRLTAKMLALGDFSGHLVEAGIDILDNRGEPLERAAMGFHHDGTVEGRPLKLRDARGAVTGFDETRAGYRSAAPNDDGSGNVRAFAVNGAPPKPGAPFADPCGAPDALAGRDPADPDDTAPTGPLAPRADPFAPGVADFVPDPGLTGFRRYEVSAVQVDIVTNKAGWHDPQGRINVLTSLSDGYKDRGPSAREEPFFFRAYSGECVEFRHTNELPKELELDDFQVRTPTDTIGQHIHLVKFDVTSADGSGNGWNYEDGTFAPDEITSRLCAMLDPASETPAVGAGSTVPAGSKIAAMTEGDWRAICEPVERDGKIDHWVPIRHDWWAATRSEAPERFQTTVQRWFADPILSIEGEADDPGEMADRTLRTVFTHDHFAPSSIQQHGFYSALVIEPAGKKVCPGLATDGEACMETDVGEAGFVAGGPGGVGVHKIVTGGDDPEIHPDYREFALAIADFALLYDPTDGDEDDLIAVAGPLPGGSEIEAPPAEDPAAPVEISPKGLARLVCEAEHRSTALDTGNGSLIERLCASDIERGHFGGSLLPVETEAVPPALVARDLILPEEVPELRRHFALVRYRAGLGQGLARPVSPPERPEAISTDHHDPYLVNYRGEPVPLRIGDTGAPDETGQDGGNDPAASVAKDAVGFFPIGNTVSTARLWRIAAAGGAAAPAAGGEAPAGTPDVDGSRRTAFECFAASHADMLGQFRRRDGNAPGPAAPAIPRPGEAVEFTPGLEQALAAAHRLDCSIDSQSPEPRGNLAHVYRSEFLADELQPEDAPHAEPPASGANDATPEDIVRNRAHGDPATPLLETYSEERVQIRLVQGAQEVQHTFSLEGLQWRRNIDQKFPAASRRLDTDHDTQTWWQECREHGRRDIAREHDRWRNGLLGDGDDLAFWQEHGERVALCDNLEAFVAAQEVGISEHFEIPSAPSKESVQVRFAPGGARATEGGEETEALDYLFHFGSQDAIWNGAWGLMRVYDAEEARDETRRIEEAGDPGSACAGSGDGSACRITDVLHALDPELRRQRLEARALRDRPDVQPAACPADAPRIEAYAVAMPLPAGQSYASWRDGFGDRDALALVHVPKALVAPWLDSGTVPETEIDRLRQAALSYYRDEPLVIRANAGDCLRLSIINALAPAPAYAQSCGHAPNGDPGPLRDCLGDAAMPRIVRLNVEPNWADESAEAGGPLRMIQQDRIDVRPSARIAFVTPMSMLTRGGRAHLPFGVNRTTSEAPGAIQVADYYLGLLRVDWKVIDFLLASSPVDEAGEVNVSNALQQCSMRDLDLDPGEGVTPDAVASARTILEGDDPDHYVRTSRREAPGGADNFPVDVIGTTYWGSILPRNEQASPPPAQVADAVARMTVDCVDRLLETQGLGANLAGEQGVEVQFPQPEARPVHAIPYAFGAVPLKPVADLFNQLPHGLFGALVVEPRGATYEGCELLPDGTGSYAPPPPRAAGSAHRGRGANTLVSFADGDDQPRRLREFVLFYQDGINLWDEGSSNEWLPIDTPVTGRGLPIVGECPVCDDTYDLGEKAVSYRAPAFHRRIRQAQEVAAEAHSDLNAYIFDADFRMQKNSLSSNSLRLWALPGEEVVVRIVHPGGRARQRAFVTTGNDYDDLFPGFGFPHSALLGPGKVVTAAFSAPVRPGCYIWSDGPRQIEAAGSWGILDVLTRAGQTSCGFHD